MCRASPVLLDQKCSITSKMHGGKYLKAEIVRKKGEDTNMTINLSINCRD